MKPGELQTSNPEAAKTETSISKEFLEATFRDPKFIGNIASIAHYSHLNLAEGVFVVRSINNQPLISDNIKSPRAKSIGEIVNSYSITGGQYLDIGARDETGKLLKDIKIEIHSHPIDPHMGESAEDTLCPSLTDLESWEKDRASNPSLISGIVVKKGTTALLFLFQADHKLEHQLYYQQWDETQSRSRLLSYLQESGIRYRTFRLNLKSKEFSDQDMNSLTDFAVE